MLFRWISSVVSTPFYRFRRAEGGVSAVEFAIIAPVLFTLFCGSIELSRVVTASNRATFVAETIAQLVSQVDKTLTAKEISAFMATSLLINPDILDYQRQTNVSVDNAVNINVSSVIFTLKIPTCTVSCEYNAIVIFSQRNNNIGPTRSCGLLQPAADNATPSPATLPISMYGPVSLVVVDIQVFIKPIFTFLYTGEVKFTRSAYYRPRLVDRTNSNFNCPGYMVTS